MTCFFAQLLQDRAMMVTVPDPALASGIFFNMCFGTVQVKMRRRLRLWVLWALPHLLNNTCIRGVFWALYGAVKIFFLALDFKKNVFIFQIREGKQCMKL